MTGVEGEGLKDLGAGDNRAHRETLTKTNKHKDEKKN